MYLCIFPCSIEKTKGIKIRERGRKKAVRRIDFVHRLLCGAQLSEPFIKFKNTFSKG